MAMPDAIGEAFVFLGICPAPDGPVCALGDSGELSLGHGSLPEEWEKLFCTEGSPRNGSCLLSLLQPVPETRGMTKAILSPRGPTRTACGPRRKPNARARGEAAGESRAGPGTARGFGELWPRWHRAPRRRREGKESRAAGRRAEWAGRESGEGERQEGATGRREDTHSGTEGEARGLWPRGPHGRRPPGGGPAGRAGRAGGGGAAGGAVSARRREECSGRRPGHVRTRGRGPRRPRPGARRRPPESGSRRGCGYGAGRRRGSGRREPGRAGGGRQLTARAPAPGNLGAPADLPGSGPGAGQGRKSSPGADPRGGRARVRVGLKFWISLEWPWARLGVGGGGGGPRFRCER